MTLPFGSQMETRYKMPGFTRQLFASRSIAHASLGSLSAALLLFAPTGSLKAQKSVGIPVLVYHRFDLQKAGPTTVRKTVFEAQLATLKTCGYTVVPLAAVERMVDQRQTPSNRREIAITVDDGHRSVYEQLFPILKERTIPVTLFIYPSVISHASYALTWAQLREMRASGLVRIESHTYWHPDFRIEKKRLGPDEYQHFVNDQLVRSKLVLEAKLKVPVTLIAWPYGIVDADLARAAEAAGYKAGFAYDGKVATPNDNRYAIHRIVVQDSTTLAIPGLDCRREVPRASPE